MLCSIVVRKQNRAMKGGHKYFGIASKHTNFSAEGGQSGVFDASVYINPLFLKRRTRKTSASHS